MPNYELTIKTSDVDSAGTDSKVFFRLFGDRGITQRVRIDTPGNDYERGSITVGNISNDDIGELIGVVVDMDNSGDAAGWSLEFVSIRNKETNQTWRFDCGYFLGGASGLPSQRILKRHPMDLNLIKGEGPEVYLILGGQRRHIPDSPTLTGLGFSWDQVKRISNSELNNYPLGQQLPSINQPPPVIFNIGPAAILVGFNVIVGVATLIGVAIALIDKFGGGSGGKCPVTNLNINFPRRSNSVNPLDGDGSPIGQERRDYEIVLPTRVRVRVSPGQTDIDFE